MKLPRNSQIWFADYVRGKLRRRGPAKRVWLTIADHYEPLWNRVDVENARERVALWRREWPRIAAEFADAAGRRPIYTFFYPEEEYRPEFIDSLAEMTRDGIADIEIH